MCILIIAYPNRKATLGIIRPSWERVHIDLKACCFAFNSEFPGSAGAAKGAGVNRSKLIVSRVHNGASQLGFYLSRLLLSESNGITVRKEQIPGANCVLVIERWFAK